MNQYYKDTKLATGTQKPMQIVHHVLRRENFGKVLSD
jgi:hypothetical protein